MVSEQRHRNMAAIRGKDTKPEMIVRKYLWAHGFRYRLNHKRLPGKPDLVLRKYRTCIFVNGCFWHGHLLNLQFDNLQCTIGAGAATDNLQSSECCKIPKTNREFWVRKIIRNKERDVEVQKQLAEMGWHCVTVWECQLSESRKFGTSELRNLGNLENRKSIREHTLESLAYTLNEIYLQDHAIHHKPMAYTMPEDDGYAMAAEDLHNE